MKFMYSVVALCESTLLYSTEQVFANTFQIFCIFFSEGGHTILFMRKERADKLRLLTCSSALRLAL